MKVSVLVVTYNHENYIVQAIDSILAQEVNFDYEILIIEDCSTDRTRSIVLDLQAKYPERIRLSLAEQNECSNKRFATEFLASPAEYVATLDGDDYWTSPHKLQKQVDFLDAHPECAICFHSIQVFFEHNTKKAGMYNGQCPKEISTLEDLWADNFIASCSVMLRKGLIDEFPEWYGAAIFGDWPLYMLHAQHGKIAYLNDIMGAYRIHQRGLWSGLNRMKQLEQRLAIAESMNAHLDYKYEKIARPFISNFRYILAEEYEMQGEMEKARMCAKKCFLECPLNKQISSKRLAQLLLRLNAPQVYKAIRSAKQLIAPTAAILPAIFFV